MKNPNLSLLILTILIGVGRSALCMPAREYICRGTEAYGSDPVKISFNVIYSDWDHKKNEYAYESVEIKNQSFLTKWF